MKKTLLAIAVAATAATSVNAAEILKTDTGSVDFYGQLRQELKKSSDDADVTLKSGSSRAGINARYVANDSVSVIGSLEFNIADTDKDNLVRKHYVGLDFGKAGTLTVGKQSTVSDDVWGAENSYFFGGTSMLPESVTYVGWLQQSMVKYAVDSDAGWLQAGVSYDNGKTSGDADIDYPVNTAEVFAGTSFGAVSVYGGGGYFDDNTAGAETELTHMMLTVAYDADNWNIGSTVWHAKDDASDLSTDSIVVAGGAKVADKTSVYGGYEFVIDFGSEGNDFSNAYAGVEYKYASWARTYAEFAVSNESEGDSDSKWGVGVRVYW